MKPITKTVLIAALVIVAVGLSAAGIAYAQGDFPHPREALAELLGLDPEDLRDRIHGGATIEELADEAGVDLEAFHEEMVANRQEDMKARIEEALADGEISQDQADWLLEGLEKGYLEGPFFARRAGQGGRHPGFNGEEFPRQRGGMFAPNPQ